MSTKALDSTAEEIAKSPALPELQPLFPDTILWLLASPDVVEVMSVIPNRSDDEEEDGNQVAVPTGPKYLHGHYIRGTALVPTAERRRALAKALVAANREGDGWALCFDADYAVRVSRGGRSADFLICFRCGNVLVVVPGDGAAEYPLGGSVAPLLRRELRRGGVGWLWFWRQ